MKKIIVLGLIIVAFFVVGFPAVASVDILRYPPSPTSPTVNITPDIVSQDQVYNALLRQNGEVVVSARVTVINGTDEPIDKVSLNPKMFSARRLSVFQQVSKEICRYKPSASLVAIEACEPVRAGLSSGFDYQLIREGGYEQLETELQDGTYVIKLSQTLKPSEQTTFFLSYRGFGYVKKGLFGRRNFNFETLATEHEIGSVTVHIQIDTDLYFRGQRSTITYREEQYAPTFRGKVSAELGYGTYTGLADTGMSAFVKAIDQSGQITKNAQFLGPNETLIVRGVYATSWFGLNVYRLLWPILVIILVIIAIYWLRRRQKQKQPPVKPGVASLSSVNTAPDATKTRLLDFWEEILYGFLGSILVPVAIGAVVGLFSLASRIDSYYYRYGLLNALWPILFLLVGFITVVASLLALPLYGGFRYGKKSGLIIFGWEALFLFIFLIILIVWAVSQGIR